MKIRLLIILLSSSLIVEAKEAFVIPESLLIQVEQGNNDVAYFIANLYMQGTDFYESDNEQGMIWMEKAATMGNAHATNALADAYHNKDKKKLALNWYKKAVDMGVAEAFEALAGYHFSGEAGLEKNCQLAYEWYAKAELRGVEQAYNNHAWYLATSADKNCRNPERAVAVFSQLKAMYDSNEAMPWFYRDTEAAVLAGIADFSAAIKLQTQLIEDVQSSNGDVEQYQLHLDQYIKRKPWIELVK